MTAVIASLRQEGRHAEAASRGLKDLLTQPWNHALRLLVADSLQRAGRTGEAIAQFEALDGTTLSAQANERLVTLRQSPALIAPVTVSHTAQAVPALPGSGATTPSGEAIPLAPFRYVPPAINRLVDANIQRSPEHKRLYELSLTGEYQQLGTEGLAFMSREKLDDELRLRIANGLGWTGRLKEADQVYKDLLTGPYSVDARLGQANILRWLGQEHLAVPVYREVLAAQPDHADAAKGLKLTLRELQPRTRFSIGSSIDSDDITRRHAGISHQWREKEGARIWEITASGVRDSSPTLAARQPELGLRYSALDLSYKPTAEISADGHSIYGNATVAFGSRPVWISAGRVNWGRLSTNPRAIGEHLSALHVGVRASFDGRLGDATLRADHYAISDNNAVQTATLRYVPSFRPLGASIKPLLGIEARKAKFSTPSYWSPEDGYGLFYAGLLGEWGGDNWDLFGSVQRGWRAFGEAGPSWSVSGGGRYWLNDRWALGFNFWAMNNLRASGPYRARSLVVNLERRWQ